MEGVCREMEAFGVVPTHDRLTAIRPASWGAGHPCFPEVGPSEAAVDQIVDQLVPLDGESSTRIGLVLLKGRL